jgi:arabinan endo-1,5-alpha-L-arabinosidase
LSATDWRVVDGSWTTGVGRLRGTGTLIARDRVRGELRAEADLRGPAGVEINGFSVRARQGAVVIRAGGRTLATTPRSGTTSPSISATAG